MPGKQKLTHQREAVECLVGTFCKYNVLLRNLLSHYQMFTPDIDRLPKLNLIGGGGVLNEVCIETSFYTKAVPVATTGSSCVRVRCHIPKIMMHEHVGWLPANQSAQLIKGGFPVVGHRYGHGLHLVRLDLGEVRFRRIFIGETDGFSHPAAEMCGEHLFIGREVNR